MIKKFSIEQIREIAQAYAECRNCHQVAKRFATSGKTVLEAARQCGVAVQAYGDWTRDKKWHPNRRAKTAPAKRRRTKAEWMAGNIGRKGVTSHGYVRVNVGNGKRQYEHILIAEKAIGRKLRGAERVHHIYCDPKDNANLLICTHDYHLALHARMRSHPYWKQFNP